jgi:hypothetical protein
MTETLFSDAFSSTLRSCSSPADKGVGLQPGRFGVQIPVDARYYFLLRNIQIGFWVHPVLPFNGYRGS